MKHIFAYLLPLFLCLTACATSNDTNTENQSSATQADTTNLSYQENEPCGNNQPIMQIYTTYNLYVFRPNFSRVELEVGQMPSKQNNSIIFCAAAAFTLAIRDTFAYDNIVGAYITHGKHYGQYAAGQHYGRFVYAGGSWLFADADNHIAVDSAMAAGGCMFTQKWIIKDNEIYEPYCALWGHRRNIYRALCEKDGTLLIAQCRQSVPFRRFAEALHTYGMNNALYMDMGSGWNHSYYRDNNDSVHILFPHTHNHCTNWLTFYK